MPQQTDANGETPQPLCFSQTHTGDWITKPIDVYPPAWRSWCSYCAGKTSDETLEQLETVVRSSTWMNQGKKKLHVPASAVED